MSHSLKERAGYWWSAIKEHLGGIASSPAGKVAGVIAFALVAGAAICAGAPLALAALIGGIVALAAKYAYGFADVAGGGVMGQNIAARLGPLGMAALNVAEFAWMSAAAWGFANVGKGRLVYRLFGGESDQMGHSWTTVDPRTMLNPRAQLGLPTMGMQDVHIGNTANFLVIDRLKSNADYIIRAAKRLPGQVGGAPEVLISNPYRGIDVLKVIRFYEDRFYWQRIFYWWW